MRPSTVARLTALEWRLLVEALAALIICQFRVRRRNFNETAAWARAPATDGAAAPVGRLRWAVEAVAKRIGGATCLCRALALQHLLSRYGHDSELRIGVKQSGDALVAHAWLVHDGHVLAGGPETGKFGLLAAWGACAGQVRVDGGQK